MWTVSGAPPLALGEGHVQHLPGATSHRVLVSLTTEKKSVLPRATLHTTCIERGYRAICPNYKQEDILDGSVAINGKALIPGACVTGRMADVVEPATPSPPWFPGQLNTPVGACPSFSHRFCFY